jgi:hypothetical protein
MDDCPYFFSKKKNPSSNNRDRKFEPIKSKSIYFTGKKFPKPTTPYGAIKVPDMGPCPRWKMKPRKFGEFHSDKLREQFLALAKQTKRDFKKLESFSRLIVGTFICTDFVDITVLPYVSTHPKGFVFVDKVPSLRAARELLSQCLHVPSTFLEKLPMLSASYRSIDLVRQNCQINLL